MSSSTTVSRISTGVGEHRHSQIVLGAGGGVRHLAMDITTPSEPSRERVRRVVADVVGDSVQISKQDSTGTKRIAFRTAGAPADARHGRLVLEWGRFRWTAPIVVL